MKKLTIFLMICVLCFLATFQTTMAGMPWDGPATHNWRVDTDTFAVINGTKDTSAIYTIANASYISAHYKLTKTAGDSCKGQVVVQVSNDQSNWARIDSATCTKAEGTAVATFKNWSTYLPYYAYARFIFEELMAATDSGAVGVDLFRKE